MTGANPRFAAAAETWALAAMQDDLGASAPGIATLQADHPGLRELADGFALSEGAVGLLALLFAAGHSAPVAQRLRTLSPHSEARGVPTWLALKAVPAATLADLGRDAPLRLLELVEVEAGVLPIEAHLRLSEAVAARLAGLRPSDPAVSARVVRLSADAAQADPEDVERLADALGHRDASGLSPLVLTGERDTDDVLAALAALGLGCCRLFADDIPESQPERDRFARVWSREAALAGDVLLVIGSEGRTERTVDFIDRVVGHVVLLGTVPAVGLRRGVSLPFSQRRSSASRLPRWQAALGPERCARVGARLDGIARQFDLRPAEIDAVCREAAFAIDAADPGEAAAKVLWHSAGRAVGVETVAGVELVEPGYNWSDLILPELVERRLRRIEAHVRHATMVMDEWGFAQRMGGRGRGVSVLLSGPSGTGKSMAAEVLASALDLRVMFIDLSQLISKYIGDTSKNVAAAFRLAERSGAVMVWNEGDAIWGARGTVGNATDRHVNAEVGDLLQRIESFRGFTIVTTNMRNAIDEAFTRRFRFSLSFPMPSEHERYRLWEQAFPDNAPLEERDWAALARLQLTGGGIRNIALSAAYHAAEKGCAINREVLTSEIAEEFRKQDRTAPTIEWGRAAA